MWSKCYLRNKIPTGQKFPVWPHNFSNGPSPMQSYMYTKVSHITHILYTCTFYV